MKAVILAAGKGTRLLPYSNILPKPLMPVEKNKDGSFKSIIEKLLEQLIRAGIKEFVIIVNYKANLIMNYLGDGSRYGCKIIYAFQETLDGNAGAFYRAQHIIGNDDVLVTDCDNFVNDDNLFVNMVKSHNKENSDLTVGVFKVENIKKFAIIKTDKQNKPIDIYEKPTDRKKWGNLAKSGMMILSNKIAMMDKKISKTKKGDYTTTTIVKYCIEKKLEINLFDIKKGFNDIGTWDEYLPILKKKL